MAGSPADLLDLAKAVAKRLSREHGWTISGQGDDWIELRVGVNLWSWGERVRLDVGEGTVHIRSECSFPLQIFDWGKNRRNVDAARKALLDAAALPCPRTP